MNPKWRRKCKVLKLWNGFICVRIALDSNRGIKLFDGWDTTDSSIKCRYKIKIRIQSANNSSWISFQWNFRRSYIIWMQPRKGCQKLFCLLYPLLLVERMGRAWMQNFYHHIPGLFHYVFVLQDLHRSGLQSADCLSATVVHGLLGFHYNEPWPLLLPNTVWRHYFA